LALEIAPLLGLAGKLAAGATTAAAANRAHHDTPSYFVIMYTQTHCDDTRGAFVVDGGMVRAAAHSGSGTGRTGAVIPAFMTCFKRNPHASR